MTSQSGRRQVSITGATGFVGSHLAEGFRDEGWRVRAIVRPGTRNPVPAGVEIAVLHLEPEGLARACDGSSLVVHAAGVIRARSPREFEAVNVAGTRAVVRASNAIGARLLFVSSLAASGGGTCERPVREEDRPEPVNAYGRSKMAAEAIVRREARVPWAILRPPAVYGPRDCGFLPLFRLASRGWFFLVTRPTAAFSLVHIDDLVRGTVMAAQADRASGETFFLAHARAHSMDGVLRGIASALDRPYRPLQIPALVVAAAVYAGNLAWALGVKPMIDSSRLEEIRADGFVCSVDRAREILGFTASVDWPEGAERTARWYREQGWI